jgi:hypothetical protein
MSSPDVEVGGEGNRVAGRDYYERPVILAGPPRVDRPGLIHCPACDRAGLAPQALLCPDCGHDFSHARRDAARRRRLRALAVLVTATALLVTLVRWFGDDALWRDDLIAVACGLLWVSAGLLWGLWRSRART